MIKVKQHLRKGVLIRGHSRKKVKSHFSVLSLFKPKDPTKLKPISKSRKAINKYLEFKNSH